MLELRLTFRGWIDLALALGILLQHTIIIPSIATLASHKFV